MSTFSKIARLVGVGVVFSIALPVYAEDSSAASNKVYASAKPIVVKASGAPRSMTLPQSRDSESEMKTTPNTAEAPDPSVTPYMTYDGATSSNTDR